MIQVDPVRLFSRLSYNYDKLTSIAFLSASFYSDSTTVTAVDIRYSANREMTSYEKTSWDLGFLRWNISFFSLPARADVDLLNYISPELTMGSLDSLWSDCLYNKDSETVEIIQLFLWIMFMIKNTLLYLNLLLFHNYIITIAILHKNVKQFNFLYVTAANLDYFY